MTRMEYVSGRSEDTKLGAIECRVLAKVGSGLREFSVDDVGGQYVLRGEARSYHVKQLAEQEVMALSPCPILQNKIAVQRVGG